MNHLGKENSFSFQRTIHALNEGLKLIIRGGITVKKIYAITFFSALLVLGNENNILANSNLSSLETNDLIVEGVR